MSDSHDVVSHYLFLTSGSRLPTYRISLIRLWVSLFLALGIGEGAFCSQLCQIALTKDSQEFVEGWNGYRAVLKALARANGRKFSTEGGARTFLLELASLLPPSAAPQARAWIESLELADDDGSNARQAVKSARRLYSAFRALCLAWNEAGGEPIPLDTLYTDSGAQTALTTMGLPLALADKIAAEHPEAGRAEVFGRRPEGGLEALRELSVAYHLDFARGGLRRTLMRWSSVLSPAAARSLLPELAQIKEFDAVSASRLSSVAQRVLALATKICERWNSENPRRRVALDRLQTHQGMRQALTTTGAFTARFEEFRRFLDPQSGAIRALRELADFWNIELHVDGGAKHLFARMREAVLSKRSISIDRIQLEDGSPDPDDQGIAWRLKDTWEELWIEWKRETRNRTFYDDITGYQRGREVLVMMKLLPDDGNAGIVGLLDEIEASPSTLGQRTKLSRLEKELPKPVPVWAIGRLYQIYETRGSSEKDTELKLGLLMFLARNSPIDNPHLAQAVLRALNSDSVLLRKQAMVAIRQNRIYTRELMLPVIALARSADNTDGISSLAREILDTWPGWKRPEAG